MAAAERRILTLAIVLASAMVAQAFGRFTWGVVLPDARDDLLDGSNTAAGLFGSLNVGAYLLGTIVVAWLASRSSLVGLVKVGLVLSTSGLVLASFTTRPAVLALALVIMGLGGAIIWVPVPGIAARQFPPERRGFATGIAGVGIGVGIEEELVEGGAQLLVRALHHTRVYLDLHQQLRRGLADSVHEGKVADDEGGELDRDEGGDA